MRNYLIVVVYVLVILTLVLGYRMLEKKEGSFKVSKKTVIDVFNKEQLEAEVLSYNGDFRVDFPGDPEYRHEQNRVSGTQSFVHRHIYTYEANTLTYYAIVSEYPMTARLPSERERLDAELQKILELGEGLAFVNRAFGTWQGNTRVDFLAEGGQQRIQGRFIVVGERLYRLFIVAGKDEELAGRVAGFLASFRLMSLPT